MTDINVSYSGGTLALQVDEDRTTPSTIESKIRALGFTPVTATSDGGAALGRSRKKRSWLSSAKARLVLMIDVLFALAFVVATGFPEYERWV